MAGVEVAGPGGADSPGPIAGEGATRSGAVLVTEVAMVKLNFGVLLVGNGVVDGAGLGFVGLAKGFGVVSGPLGSPKVDVEGALKGLPVEVEAKNGFVRLASGGFVADGRVNDGWPNVLGSVVTAVFSTGCFAVVSGFDIPSSDSSLTKSVSSAPVSSSIDDSSMYPSARALETLMPSITAESVLPSRFFSTRVFEKSCFLCVFESAWSVRGRQAQGTHSH